jgi:hypothetical protein
VLTRVLPATAIVEFLIHVCVALAIGQEKNQPPKGFTALFNGRDIGNWSGEGIRDSREMTATAPGDRARNIETKKGTARKWHVDHGVLFGDGPHSTLTAGGDFGDFELWVDWKIGSQGDGGIYLRGTPGVHFCNYASNRKYANSSEKDSGTLSNDERFGRFPYQLTGYPVGGWGRMYVRIVGPFVTLRLNDKDVIRNEQLENTYDRHQHLMLSGPICLQTNSPETEFRNIFIRKIPADESAKALGQVHGGEEGFEPLFNGRDLRNWIGDVDSYQIVDGAIQCRQNKEGTLLTKERYDNFVVRLEFKLPPVGNSGLAIRAVPSDKVPAYDALEVQILDDSAKQYAHLKPYQFHGSLYGLAPATRGYLRPHGEWNYQETTVNGDHFRVNLNGFEILNVVARELPAVALDGEKHPGVSRTSGHFGFCGHDDPVAFRNIRIKRLSVK